MKDIKETRSSKPNRTDTHMNTQKLGQHTQDLHMSRPEGLPEIKGEVGTNLSLT